MIKKLLFCLTLAFSVLTMSGADGDWKLHPSFDSEFQQIFDTPERVYIIAYGQPYNPNFSAVFNEQKGELFVYDKSSGETLAYNMRNYLSGNIITSAQYNPRAGYLCVLYSDANIDLIYDNGKVVNIPALKNSTIQESKTVNDITFGWEDNNIYLATEFGFVVIDPKSNRITKARNYHTPMKGIARVGKKLILSTEKGYYIQDFDKPLSNLSDFVKSEDLGGQQLSKILPMPGSKALACMSWSINLLNVKEDNTLEVESLVMNDLNPPYYSAGKEGYTLSGSWCLIYVSYDGAVKDLGGYPEQLATRLTSSYDGKTYYLPDSRNGIVTATRDGYKGWGTTWTVGNHLSRPNAPSPFLCESMVYSDKYGLLVMNQGVSRLFQPEHTNPTLISGLKNGEWVNYGTAYVNPDYTNVHRMARGLAIDPANPDLVYSGSRFEGLQILDLSNPQNIVNIGASNSPAASLPGFVSIAQGSDAAWHPYYMSFSAPKFDSQGNLWVANDNLGVQYPHVKTLKNILVWPAASLKNKKYNDFYQIDGHYLSNFHNIILPLRADVNRNLVLVLCSDKYGGAITLLDTRGTLDNDADDRTLSFTSLINQDGGSITYQYVQALYEDPETGIVWVGCSNGVFTIQPSKLFDAPNQGRRVKVARNDGTNQADYLLDGCSVYDITSDGSGNMWFATYGAGVVQTSRDGSHVMRQLTTANSYLPTDNTFSLCYNKGNNSMMIGTMDGLAEFFVPGASSGDGFDRVKIYPNPVRPDFVGYITIEGLMDNSLVKICDSEGNLVKELGSPMDGVVRWDGTTLSGAKANSGVYFVLMSRSGELASEANVGKVVIIR